MIASPPNMTVVDCLKEFIHYSEIKQSAHKIATLQQKKKFHSLAVLSFFPSEGKTLFCATLAMAYAETHETRVLVIDTTTQQNKSSLDLRECLDESNPRVDVLSLAKLRKSSNGHSLPSATDFESGNESVLEPDIMPDGTTTLSSLKKNYLSLIKKETAERSKQYGLVLLDTTPLNAKNKSNVDPMLVAHMADASVLLVSRKLLESPNLDDCLKVLKDPTLHLIGMIANEEFTP